MDCFKCKRTAVGVCRFCGRAVCEEHANFEPYILNLYRSGSNNITKALVVEDALCCGMCKPRPEPVELKELE